MRPVRPERLFCCKKTEQNRSRFGSVSIHGLGTPFQCNASCSRDKTRRHSSSLRRRCIPHEVVCSNGTHQPPLFYGQRRCAHCPHNSLPPKAERISLTLTYQSREKVENPARNLLMTYIPYLPQDPRGITERFIGLDDITFLWKIQERKFIVSKA